MPAAYLQLAQQLMLVEELFYGQDLRVQERAIDLLRANLAKRLTGTQTDAAADAKISLPYFNQIFKGRKDNPGLDKIDGIADAFNAPVAALFLSEGVTLSDIATDKDRQVAPEEVPAMLRSLLLSPSHVAFALSALRLLSVEETDALLLEGGELIQKWRRSRQQSQREARAKRVEGG